MLKKRGRSIALLPLNLIKKPYIMKQHLKKPNADNLNRHLDNKTKSHNKTKTSIFKDALTKNV
jgi:hypothetical protein